MQLKIACKYSPSFSGGAARVNALAYGAQAELNRIG